MSTILLFLYCSYYWLRTVPNRQSLVRHQRYHFSAFRSPTLENRIHFQEILHHHHSSGRPFHPSGGALVSWYIIISLNGVRWDVVVAPQRSFASEPEVELFKYLSSLLAIVSFGCLVSWSNPRFLTRMVKFNSRSLCSVSQCGGKVGKVTLAFKSR